MRLSLTLAEAVLSGANFGLDRDWFCEPNNCPAAVSTSTAYSVGMHVKRDVTLYDTNWSAVR